MHVLNVDTMTLEKTLQGHCGSGSFYIREGEAGKGGGDSEYHILENVAGLFWPVKPNSCWGSEINYCYDYECRGGVSNQSNQESQDYKHQIRKDYFNHQD